MSSAKRVNKHLSQEQISRVLLRFFGSTEECEWSVIDQGNINDTFLARNEKGSFIVQRINGTVFPNPEYVAENTALVSAHICRKNYTTKASVFPEVVTTVSGENCYKDNQGNVWRAQKYIRNSISHERVEDSRQALEIGKCLGRFHRMVQDLSPATLATTLPGFHDLPEYLKKFNDSWTFFSGKSSEELQFCLSCIDENRSSVSFFKNAVQRGDLQLAVTHGDPKITNVLFDKNTNKALTLIDLDTVGPGLTLQDLGDCLRSCCCRADENAYDAAIECEPVYVAGVVEGYLSENDLCHFEQEHLYTALHLITFELGIRFLTDYLDGNRYFKVLNRNDNLYRALIQFKLVKSIEAQKNILCSMIADAVHQHMK